MVRQKLKIQWIVDKKRRKTTLRKRRATLLEKASELATLCDVAVAVVVYGYGEAEPTTWPSAAEAKQILQRYVDLPDISKGNMNIESFLRDRIKKVTRTLDNLKHGNRNRNADLILNEISLQRRHNLDDLTPELAAAVMSSYVARMKLIDRCIKFPLSQAIVAVPPPPAGAEAELVPVPQEPLVAPPLAMTPAVADAPAPVVAPGVADAPVPLVPMDLDGEPRHGSFLKEMAEAIMDDGSGRDVVPTADDVDRILMEHGLHGLFNPQ